MKTDRRQELNGCETDYLLVLLIDKISYTYLLHNIDTYRAGKQRKHSNLTYGFENHCLFTKLQSKLQS